MYIFGKNNNHLIKNNYKTTFSLPQKIKLIQKQIIKCACGVDFIICLANDQKPYCYFQSAVYNIDFKQSEKIFDIDTEQNLILFVTQKGQLYTAQFMAEKLLNDTLKPKLVRLNLSFLPSKQRKIKQVKMIDGQIFLKMENNFILYLKRNDWMETKTFSDPQLVFASKNYNITDVISFKGSNYFLTKDRTILSALKNELSINSRRIQMKEKLSKIVSNSNQIFGINEEGSIVRINVQNGKAKVEKIWKISTCFVDLIIGNQNYYGITQNRQVWVWGKNAHGQLGLSDYEPRTSLYPLISLENFYVKQIFSGENYVCCLVNNTKSRDKGKETQRQSLKSYDGEIRFFIGQNNSQECRDNFNQTDEFLMPIRYTQEESRGSNTDHNESCSEANGNASCNKKNKNEKENLFKKSLKDQKKPSDRQSQKSSIRNKNAMSKVSSKKISQNSCSRSKGKLVISNFKLTPKSVNGQKSLFNHQKQKVNQHYLSNVSDKSKSLTKNQTKQAIVSHKTSSVEPPFEELNYKKKIEQEYQQKFQKLLSERESKQRDNINMIKETYAIQKQRFEEKNRLLQFQLKNKIEENQDLFQLVAQKNRTIEDITSKIRLLEDAIEQHEKTLTARDNEAEDFFLKEKQYQLHIQKLQTQVQKMMEVLNYNERNKETEIYKKQMDRLSTEIKERIEDQKQYYRQKIKSIERNFDQERNLYQIQIRNLQQELVSYQQKQSQFIAKQNYQLSKPSIQISTSFVENNSSNCMESPTFHTLDIKNNLKKHVQDNYGFNQSQITLNDKVNEDERIPLKQSNRQELYRSPLQIGQYDIKTRKNSRVNNISKNVDAQNEENQPISRQKSKSQVKEILQKIQVSKTYISKSANKLFNLLENDKV